MSEHRPYLEWSMGAAGPVLAALDDEPVDWRDFALCAETDPESFFPEKGGSTKEAKKVCRSCEVRSECLEYALDHDERFGIWGGLSERERRNLKRAAGARPHKSTADRQRIEAIRLAGERTCSGPCGQAKPLGEFPRRGGLCMGCLADRMREMNRRRREARETAGEAA